MAASRMGISSFKRYRIFLYLAAFTIVMQLYLGYNFYSINKTELDRIQELENQRKASKLKHTRGLHNSEQENTNGILEDNDRYKRDINNNLIKHSNNVKNNSIPNMDIQKGNKFGINKHEYTKLNEFEMEQIEPELEERCDLQAPEAQSAISRAKTVACKQQIMDVVCKHQNHNMFPESLPRLCPLKGHDAGELLGCYSDNRSQRHLTSVKEDFRNDNSPARCIQYCHTAGLKHAGLQYGFECWCGDNVDKTMLLSNDKCDHVCPGNPQVKCGGYLTLSIYRTGVGEKPNNPAPLVRTLEPNDVPVKIVFVLTLNGRALRQVMRLFKLIFDPGHYYYIHVDSRQEYLYRELLPLRERFGNVHVTDQRLSTIWGGASLLLLHLNCMKELLTLKHWNWDYYINLSESDFPVKPVPELVAYLTRNQGMNFLRAHGTNTPKFIKKQGLDKLFVECDTHMWRVGVRHVPRDIVMSGGSDWFGIHRNYADYVVNSQDQLVVDLKFYYKYALLPAESFFHTLLLNSEFCTTFVDNNLHMTNWNRKQGCKCQYKAIVDWCGCSPNDYLPHDYNKLMTSKTHPTFFARKFEAIVSEDIITAVEQFVTNKSIKGVPAMRCFWLNEFHHLDVNTNVDEAYITYYHSLARQGIASLQKPTGSETCKFKMADLLQVHMFSYKDIMQGMIVQSSVMTTDSDGASQPSKYIIETLVQPVEGFKQHLVTGDALLSRQLKYVHVGTSWDPKEELFRNYGKLLGPRSSITMAIHWETGIEGQENTITAVFIDPSLHIAASYDLTIKWTDRVTTHTPLFEKPLRPGVWKLQILRNWQLLAETSFIIIPLTHLTRNSSTLTTGSLKMLKQLHSGPVNSQYVQKDFTNFNTLLKISDIDTLEAEKQAVINSEKSGSDLLDWVDRLTAFNYRIGESCVHTINSNSIRTNDDEFITTHCPTLSNCKDKKWSSLSPDPKSELQTMKWSKLAR